MRWTAMEEPQRRIIVEQSNIFLGEDSFVNNKEAVQKNKSLWVQGKHLILKHIGSIC